MTEFRSFLLANDVGDEVCITNYGARIVQWYTLVDGIERNIVLGYSSLTDYLQDPSYLGAMVGPYANRIANSTFSIDDHLVDLQANDGNNHLHGGKGGLSDVYWEVEQQESQKLVLSYEFEDGTNGYPGNINFTVCFCLADDSQLSITISACTEQPTLIGPTSHPYFNLAGEETDADEHLLQLNAQYYTEIDDSKIPTGEILPVENTRFDFTKPRILNNKDERDCINHNFVINQREDWHAKLISPDKKLQLHITSDYPGLQLNTGDVISAKFSPREGLCLEPQFFPDSPNQQDFPFHFTTPEKPFHKEICYKLVKLEQANETQE